MFNGATKFAGSVAAITLIGMMVGLLSCAPYRAQHGYPGAGQVAGGEYQSSPTPPLPTATPDQTAGWKTYSSAAYGVSLRYPPSWERDPRYNLPNSERYDGPDGFFMLSASNANTIDEAAQFEANQKLRPYGSNPTITKTQVQGQDARLIMPSSDQAATMDNQVALIVLSPQPIRIGGTSFKELILWADKAHVQAIAGTLRFATPTAAAANLTTTPESGARITLTPDSGPPGTAVEIEGYLPDVSAVVTNSVNSHANVCWARCPGGLQDEGLVVQWSTDQPGHFNMRFTVPVAPWLDSDGIHALTAGDYVVGVQCLAQPTPVTKGPGCVQGTQGPAQATATFHLTGPTPTECTALPCGRLSLSPGKGPPGTLVTVTGWAPLDSQIFGDRPFGYYLALQRPGAASDNPWLGQVQQAPDGSLSGSFLVPVAFGSFGQLTPGPYTLSLEALLTDGITAATRPLPGLTVTPLGKGGSVLGARVTFAPTPFTVTAAPTWASLGQLKPLWSQWSAQLYGGAAVVGDPADPQRLAYCTAGGIRVSSDGGGTWKTISTDGAVQAVAATEFEFIPNDPIPPACSAVALDPTHPASFYATFVVVKKPQQFPPPENLIGLVTTDGGQSWEAVPTPPGYNLEQYGGFQASGRDVQALFGERTNPPGQASFAVEATTDGGRTWTPGKLTCPASGPCVRWGPAPSIIGGMGVGYPQAIEVSADAGQSWMATNSVFLNQGPSELAALSQTDVALLSGFSPFPLVISHDGGRTWEDVALPSLGGAGDNGFQYPGLQMLPNGDLLARGDQRHGWLMLAPEASQWCEVAGAAIPASVSSFWAIGDRLWWVQMAGTPTEARTIGSVSIADLKCGQAIPPTQPTPVTSGTNRAPIATAAALDAVFLFPAGH